MNLVDLAAEHFDRPAHVGVAFQHPARFEMRNADFRVAPPHLFDQRQEDRAAGRASLQRLARAKQQQPRRFELMRAESLKRARPAEGEQAAVEIGENLVEIGKRDRKGLRNAVKLDDDAEIRRHEILQRVGVGVEFFLGEGHEAPIAAPAVVEQLGHQRGLALLQGLHVQRPEFQAIAPFAPRRNARRLVALVARNVEAVGQEVLRLLIAQRLEMAREIGRMPGHEEHRRRVEAIDKKSALLVDRRRERSVDPRRALGAQPVLGGLGQRAHDLDVVDGVERAELRIGGADRRDAGLIDLRHDAADPLAITAGEKFLLFDELVMRVELMREDAPALDVERRREALRAGIKQPRQPAEGRKAQRAVDRKNLDPRHMQVLAAAGLNRKRQSDAGRARR